MSLTPSSSAPSATAGPVEPAPRVASIPAHILELDGFRAIAIYLVINLHFGVYVRYLPWYNAITHAGWVGVPLFFVLSGMLLSLPFVAAGLEQRRCPSVPRFYRRRALRIFPLFYISMGVFLLVRVARRWPLPPAGELIRHLLFLHNYQPEFSSVNPPYWSLAVEVQFYLVMPVVGLALYRLLRAGRARAACALLVGLSLLSLLYRVIVVAQPALLQRLGYKLLIYASTVSNFDSFALGMLCAVLYARATRRSRPMVGAPWAYALVASSLAGLYLLMRFDASSGYKEGATTWFAPSLFYTLLNACWAACIVGTLSLPRSRWARLLRSPFMVFVSTISYSLYIWHMLCADASRTLWRHIGLGPGPVFIVANLLTEIAFVFALSTFSYYVVERPFLRIKGRT